jgi:hypothetical protein
MSVSSAPPSSSVSAAAAAAGTTTGPAQTVVVQVLASYGGDSVRNGLIQTLLNAAGSGNILSGIVADIRPDGTFTLQTKTGAELVLHHPPELPLTAGSAVTLRLVSISPTPQVSILTVDGKLVGSQLTGPLSPPPNNAATPAPTTPTPASNPATAGQAAAGQAPTGQPASLAPGATPIPGIPVPLPAGSLALPPATLASTVLATISLADEVAIESALSGGAMSDTPVGEDALASAESVIATLVRAAPARAGGTPIPPGTRYLATVSIGSADAEAAKAPLPSQGPAQDPALGPAGPDADDQASTPIPADDPTVDDPMVDDPTVETPASAPQQAAAGTPADLTNFKSLTTVLAGRVLTPPTANEILVETSVGTLSIPAQDPPPVGSAIQLKITAVAPPQTAVKPVVTKAPTEAALPPQPLLQDAVQALAQVAPALVQQIQDRLSLPASDQLTSMILNFLGGIKSGPTPARWPDPPSRKALVEAGRGDIATKLDAQASQIGQHRPAPAGEWSITILPYLEMATTEPMRLYRRAPDQEERERGGGDRFVIELQLVRLGPLQFDGLVRDRRFDLVLRSEQPVEDGLKQLVERTFRDSLLIAGWAGEISYARTGPVPMIPLQPDGTAVGLSA